jgi:membrane associated rhomboid family serine protease
LEEKMIPNATVSTTTNLHILEAEEAERWTRRLNRTERPCGCKSSGALTLIAIVGWPAFVLATGLPHTLLATVIALVTYAGVVVAAAIAGKLAGIVIGRLYHRWLRRRLANRLLLVATANADIRAAR